MTTSHVKNRNAEHGGAGAKLLVALAILILIANAGFNFIPVAYQAENFKQEMHTAVVQGISLPSTHGQPADIVRFKISNAVRTNELPYDTFVEVKEKNNILTARVYYVKKVPLLPFGAYEYEYIFDHSVTPSGFLTQ